MSIHEENRKWKAEELRSCSPFFMLLLVFPFSSFSRNHCFYVPLSLCSLFLCSFTNTAPEPLPSEGQAVWFRQTPSPTTSLTASKKLCGAVLCELVSALVYSRQDEKTKCLNIKRKSYSSWWQVLDVFAGVAILMRFAVKSIHSNVRGVHRRFRWTSDWNKEKKL